MSRPEVGATHPITPRSASLYSPTRRTAVILIGEGTSAAYLGGALKALDEAGVRFDILMGKGVGAVVAALGAIRSGERVHGREGILEEMAGRGPSRWRAPFAAAGICLAGAFLVFIAPAVLSILLLVALSLFTVVRMVAPETVTAVTEGLSDYASVFAGQVDSIYLRLLAFPLALLFAYFMVVWIVPGFFKRERRGGSWLKFFGEGVVHLSPFAKSLERTLWEAVRGASLDARPHDRREVGARYRDLLTENVGQSGFRELVFYALDLDTGQEVPFAFLKDRWFGRLGSRGPGGGAVGAEPVSLTGEDAPLLFDALVAAVTPPGLAPSVPLRLPVMGRYGGEVHRFGSSLLAGQSAVADAVAAGAEQVIYVSPTSSSPTDPEGSFERLASGALRQILENDLRWAERERPALVFFLIRPERQKLGLFEFAGRSMAGGERLTLGALVAQGQRDAYRLFIQPMAGDSAHPPAASRIEDPTVQL